MVPKLAVVFFLSLFCALLGPVVLPSMRLLAFAPFLVILYTRLALIQCLYCAFGCGLLIDLLSSSMQLGTHALNYVLITLLLFRIRRFFFAHKPVALALFTALFSLLSCCMQLIIMAFYDQHIPFGLAGFLSDFVIMPIADGIYAFIGYTCPIYGYRWLRKFLKKIKIASYATK
ncbi:MAG TPA: hypothetical protein PLO43_01315 [Chlamydiales bacterium]|nr:hypothetical protein [Chlamydiales bacterium]